MRNIIVEAEVSLDGITGEDNREFWAQVFKYHSDDVTDYLNRLLEAPEALLMGRITYQGFAEIWPSRQGPMADIINAMPKYVASRSLTQTPRNATLLGPDPSSAIARLKDQPGKDLIKYGTSRFDDTLVRDHLIDEFRFWIMPVVAGPGRRLFEDVDTSSLDLRLTDQRRLENGSVILTYTPS